MKYRSAQTRKRSLSTPQRLLRRSLRRSLDLAQLRSLPATSSSPFPAIARDYPSVRLFGGGGGIQSRNDSSLANSGDMPSSSSSEISASTVNMANLRVTDASDASPPAAGKRNSQEPLRKRQRKVAAGMVPPDTGDSNLLATPKPASRSQSPTIKRSIKGRSTTPRRSTRGHTPTAKFDPFVSNGDSSQFPPRGSSKNVVVENNTITVTKLSTSVNFDVPQLTKTQETTIQVEGIPYEAEDEDEDDEDYRDFMPENLPSGSPAMRNGNGTVSSRRSARKQPETINKVKTGRVSKFKEGTMNDRASTRPPADLIGYAYSNRKGVSQAVSEASHSTNTNSKTVKREKLSFLPRKYTGDEVFTFGGFITSVFQFRGLEYCRENLWGPKRQKFYDKLHGNLEKMKEQRELDEIKAKAEALYKLRKEKEWKDMEAKKQKATEELRRRKQRELERKERLKRGKLNVNATSSIGVKRKYGAIAESFGEGGQDRVWDEAEQAAKRQLEEEEEATDVDGDIGSDYHSDANGPIVVGEDDLSSTEEESEMDEDELAKVEELARSVTGKDIVAQVFPSRSPSVATSLQASPTRRRKFVPADSIDLMIFSQECEVPEFNQYPASVEHSDLDSDHGGYSTSFLKGPKFGKSSTAPSESGASSSGGNTAKKGKSLQAVLKNRASRVFGGASKAGQGNGDANAGSFNSAGSMDTEASERTFTKKDLQKQEKCKMKVMDLEAKLLDAWKELEAAGGVQGLGLNSQTSEKSNGKPKANGTASAAGDGGRAMGPPPVPAGKNSTMM